MNYNINKFLLGFPEIEMILGIHKNFPLDKHLGDFDYARFIELKNVINKLARISAEHSEPIELSQILKLAIEKRKNIAIIDEFNSSQLSSYLNLPLKEISLNRKFVQEWLEEEEGKIINGRTETETN